MLLHDSIWLQLRQWLKCYWCGSLHKCKGQWHPMPTVCLWVWVDPSRRLPSERKSLTGSLVVGTCSLLMDLQRISLRCLWECRCCLAVAFLQASPWRPLASTCLPQRHSWGWHVLVPSRWPTATRMASLLSLKPILLLKNIFKCRAVKKNFESTLQERRLMTESRVETCQ